MPPRMAELKIRNYRSIEEASLRFDDLTLLIGKNNAGKSNVLSAAALVIEGTAKDLAPHDFHEKNGVIAAEFTIEVKLKGVQTNVSRMAEEHRTKLERYIVEDSIRLKRVGTRTPDLELSSYEIWSPAKTAFTPLPTGIPNSIKQLLPEVIYIEAFKDPSEEAKGKSSAVLGKILKQILTAVTAQIDIDVKDALEDALARINPAPLEGDGVDRRAEELIRVEADIRDRMREVFEDSDVRLQFQIPTFSEWLAQATMLLKDQGDWAPPESKGQGFQRALYLALLRVLAAVENVPVSESPIPHFLLLVEEPEAFLHPGLQRQMGDTLHSISARDQVIAASHSPFVVAPDRLASIVFVRRPGTGGSRGSGFTFPDTSVLPAEDDKRLLKLLSLSNSSEFLFSDFVLVAEGISDRALLGASMSRLRKEGAISSGLGCVLDVDGKDALVPTQKVLLALGFRSKAVADADFIWNGATRVLASDPGFIRFHQEFQQAAANAGIWDAENSTVSRGGRLQAMAMLAGNMNKGFEAARVKLRDDHGLWVLSKGEIEGYFGLSQGSKGDYVRCAREVLAGGRSIDPEVLQLLTWTAS